MRRDSSKFMGIRKIDFATRPVQLMIVGAQKTGTTSLQRYLAQHPSICTHPQAEMAYFMLETEYNLDYDRAFQRFFKDCRAVHAVLLAKHVMVMYSPKAVKRLYNHNPDMHLLILLRNPIDRAYSAYWYARRMGWEDIETFEKAIDAEPARLKEGWWKWRNCAYLYNGTYVRHLGTLLECFKREQVHVYLTEELRKEPQKICHSIFSLFALDPVVALDLDRHHNVAKKARSETFAGLLAGFFAPQNPIRQTIRGLFPDELAHQLRDGLIRLNEIEFTPPPMNPETQVRMIEYFELLNTQLGELLGRDLSHWNNPTS
jgi:hypothetical protein